MSTLERAIALAAEAHAGQRQRNDEPYILHPLRLMMQMDNDEERMAAVLHDVVEDTDWTLEELSNEGFSETVLKIVDLLTHYDSDSYADYVNKLKDHPQARHIKIADLQDNMNIRRLKNLKDKDFERLEKYHTYWKLLKKADREK